MAAMVMGLVGKGEVATVAAVAMAGAHLRRLAREYHRVAHPRRVRPVARVVERVERALQQLLLSTRGARVGWAEGECARADVGW